MAYKDVVLADGPVSYWQLGETAGASTAADSAGSNPLTVAGTVTLGQPGLLAADTNTSALFAGGDAANAATTGISGSAQVTLEAWVLLTANPGLSNVLNIQGNDLWIGLNASNLPTFLLFNGGNVSVSGSKTLSLGTPHHLVGTYDGAILRVYVDGAQAGPGVSSGAISYGATVNATVAAASGGAASKFAGTVAHVAFYAKALTAAQILNHYTSGIPSTTPFLVFPPPQTLNRGVRTPAQISLYRRRAVSNSFSAAVFQDSPTGALIFGGALPVEIGGVQVTTPPPGQVMPLRRGIRDPREMRRYAPRPASSSVLFSDSPTGALIFAGSVVESKTNSDSPTGALIFAGSSSESKTGADSTSGALIFAGSRVEAKTGSDARSGALIFAGSETDAKTGADSTTGALIFGGADTETDTSSPAPSGALAFGGSSTEANTAADSPSGSLIFTGSESDIYTPPGGGTTFTDAPSGTLIFAGSLREGMDRTGGGGGTSGKLREKQVGKKYQPDRWFYDDPNGIVRVAGRVTEHHDVDDAWVVEEEEVELLLALA